LADRRLPQAFDGRTVFPVKAVDKAGGPNCAGLKVGSHSFYASSRPGEPDTQTYHRQSNGEAIVVFNSIKVVDEQMSDRAQ